MVAAVWFAFGTGTVDEGVEVLRELLIEPR